MNDRVCGCATHNLSKTSH